MSHARQRQGELTEEGRTVRPLQLQALGPAPGECAPKRLYLQSPRAGDRSRTSRGLCTVPWVPPGSHTL